VRQEVLDMALERTELSPRELAVTFIDEKAYFISQASVYRLLKAHDLEAQIDAFVGHYNHRRYHESLKNLTPADVYFGRGQTILLKRERIKRKTIEHRRLQHAKAAA
jgi:transposase InsO family protein